MVDNDWFQFLLYVLYVDDVGVWLVGALVA